MKEDKLILFKIGNGTIAANVGNGFGIISPSETIRGRTPSIERIIDPGFRDFIFKRYYLTDLHALIFMSDGVEFPEAKIYNTFNHTLNMNFARWFEEIIQSTEIFREAIEKLGKIGEDDISVITMFNPNMDFKGQEIIRENPLRDADLYCMRNSLDRINEIKSYDVSENDSKGFNSKKEGQDEEVAYADCKESEQYDTSENTEVRDEMKSDHQGKENAEDEYAGCGPEKNRKKKR